MKSVASPPFVELTWDSDFFGFPVAKVVAELDDWSLNKTLAGARAAGIRLLYYLSIEDHPVPSRLLKEFTGALVDRRVTFGKAGPGPACPALSSSWSICEFPQVLPTQELLELAVAAGAFSRFAVDPRIPRSQCAKLYESWMQQSCLGEMADCVLGAFEAGPFSPCLGMITLAFAEDEARIGLIAVQAKARGKGIGSALIQAAHRKMAERGICRAVVITQLANVPACRLYERCGYRICDVQNYYHFWLQ
jgi:dTDP-4-amino-4,6-dideoxy-D-galactose acyltransferase